MLKACYNHAMANLQVKNISDALHRKLHRAAKQQNKTLGELVVTAVENELARAEFRARLAARSITTLPVSASSLLDEARNERDVEQAR